MKRYEKPSLEVVKIKVSEDFAVNNTTIYDLGGNNNRDFEKLSFELMGGS